MTVTGLALWRSKTQKRLKTNEPRKGQRIGGSSGRTQIQVIRAFEKKLKNFNREVRATLATGALVFRRKKTFDSLSQRYLTLPSY